MKSKIFLGLLVVLLTGCKQEPQKLEQQNLIQVKASVELTKSIINGTEFADLDEIGVYVVPYTNSTTEGVLRAAGNYRDNQKYQANSVGDFTAPATAYFPNGTTKVSLYAVSPYVAGGVTSVGGTVYNVSVKDDQSSKANFIASDFMNAYVNNVDPKGVAAPALLFKHKLSKITALLKLPTIYKGETVVGVKSITLKKVNIAGTVDTGDDLTKFTNDNVIKNVTMYNAGVNGESVNEFAAIVMPTKAAIAYEVDVVITVGASGSQKDFKFSYIGSQEFKPGVNHTLSITTFEDQRVVTLGGGVINGWGTPGTINGGDVYEKGADEKFIVKKAVVGATQVNITCNDGYVYKVPVVLENGTNYPTFRFTGEFALSPEKYPYTITKLEFLDASNVVVIGGGTLSKVVSAPTGTVIELATT